MAEPCVSWQGCSALLDDAVVLDWSRDRGAVQQLDNAATAKVVGRWKPRFLAHILINGQNVQRTRHV